MRLHGVTRLEQPGAGDRSSQLAGDQSPYGDDDGGQRRW